MDVFQCMELTSHQGETYDGLLDIFVHVDAHMLSLSLGPEQPDCFLARSLLLLLLLLLILILLLLICRNRRLAGASPTRRSDSWLPLNRTSTTKARSVSWPHSC